MSAYITLLGAPGSGKGTQAKRLADTLRIPIVGIGDLIRTEISKKTELGKLVQPIVNEGRLVPDSIITEIFKVNVTEDLLRSGLIADGYPRNLNQAISFDETFKGKPLKVILIYIKVPYEKLKDRLMSRGREDDTDQVIMTRNKVYEESTEPILDYFAGRVCEVDGDRSEDAVFTDILKLIKEQA